MKKPSRQIKKRKTIFLPKNVVKTLSKITTVSFILLYTFVALKLVLFLDFLKYKFSFYFIFKLEKKICIV